MTINQRLLYQLFGGISRITNLVLSLLLAFMYVRELQNAFWIDLCGKSSLTFLICPIYAGMIFLVIPFAFSVVLHEVGHMVLGRLNGFRPVYVLLGPLVLVNEAERWRTRMGPFFLGGAVGMLPVVSEQRLIQRTFWMVAGGPIITVALLLGSGIMWLRTGPGDPWHMFWTGMTILNTMLAISSLLPLQGLNLSSDGANILMMLAGGPECERQLTALVTGVRQAIGVRPSEWDGGALQRSATIHDSSLAEFAITSLAYAHAYDLDDHHEMAVYMDRLKVLHPLLPQAMRDSFYLGAAFFEASVNQDPIAAQEWYDRVHPRYSNRRARLHTEAMIHLMQDDPATALKLALEAAGEPPTQPHLGTTTAETEKLDNMIIKLRLMSSI